MCSGNPALLATDLRLTLAAQARLVGIFRAPDASPGHVTPLKNSLEQLVASAVRRQSLDTSTPVLPRLPESLRRFYGALQKYGGRSIVEVLQVRRVAGASPARHRRVSRWSHRDARDSK